MRVFSLKFLLLAAIAAFLLGASSRHWRPQEKPRFDESLFAPALATPSLAQRLIILSSHLDRVSTPGHWKWLRELFADDPETLSWLLERWTEVSPEEALAYARTLPSRERASMTSDILSQWALTEPQKAFDYAQGDHVPGVAADPWPVIEAVMTQDLTLGITLSRRVNSWGRSHPRAAAWMRAEPEKAVRRVQAEPSCWYRDMLLADILKHWLEQDAEAAIQWLEREDAKVRFTILQKTLETWPEGEVAMGAELVSREKNLYRRHTLAQMLTRRWGKLDPKACLDWIEINVRGETRQTLLKEVLTLYASDDKEAALTWVDHMPEGTLQVRLRRTIGS